MVKNIALGAHFKMVHFPLLLRKEIFLWSCFALGQPGKALGGKNSQKCGSPPKTGTQSPYLSPAHWAAGSLSMTAEVWLWVLAPGPSFGLGLLSRRILVLVSVFLSSVRSCSLLYDCSSLLGLRAAAIQFSLFLLLRVMTSKLFMYQDEN